MNFWVKSFIKRGTVASPLNFKFFPISDNYHLFPYIYIYPWTNLLMFARLTSGMSGTLFVTTLKLSLKLHLEDELNSRQNKILGPWDIPLTRSVT